MFVFFHFIFIYILIAKLSQWDLIFHGTEQPAQPNDTPYNGKSSLDSNYGGELEQNSLFDAETPSGQWRDMQQVFINWF